MSRPPTALYRNLLREARHMTDYNFRSYAIRRIKQGFQKHRNLSGDEAQKALQEGERQMQSLKRQAMLSQMYPSAKSVMQM